MAQFTKCPRCGARYEVTTCPDGTTLVCDVCGFDIVVTYETENVIPGGLTAGSKVLADGSKWIDCPKCGFSTDISSKSPGNRFRCPRCNLLLQVPVEKKERRQTRALRGEDLLTCPGCKTKYDVSGFTPGNRFRCRSCGLSLKVTERGEWTGAGEWEIDADKGLIKCNGCGKSYPISNYLAGKAFECSTCRKAFTPSVDLAQIDAKRSAAAAAASARPRDSAEEWDLDIASGMVKCLSCLYTYDISGMKSGADFVCPRCQKVFRMPAKVKESNDRVGIVCHKCGAVYDVSGYLRGTMFGCEKCDAVILVGGHAPAAAPVPVPAQAGAVQAGMAPAAIPTPQAPASDSEPRAAEAPGPAIVSETAGEKRAEEPVRPPLEARAEAPAASGAAGAKEATIGPERPEEAFNPAPQPEPEPAAEPAIAPEPVRPGEDAAHDSKEPAPKTAHEKILIACGSCGQKYRVPPIPEGKKKRCKKCGGILRPLDSDTGPKHEAKSAEEIADETLARLGAVDVAEIQAGPPAGESAKEEGSPEGAAPAEEKQAEPEKPREGGEAEPPEAGEPGEGKAESSRGSSERKKSKIRKKHKT